MQSLEPEIKQLIVQALKLEDIEPADIDSAAPLFGEGLGLDSIDALELGVALRQRYGIKIETVNEQVRAYFHSVRSLAVFVAAHRGNANQDNDLVAR